MLIQSAYKTLEVDKTKTIAEHCLFRYLSLKINGNYYRMIFELNKGLGLFFLRQWMVNEETETSVPDRYIIGENVNFDCSNGLCGKRPFEFSITYEFCFKPMGIPLESIENRKDNWSMYPEELKDILKENNIEFEVVLEGTY